MVGFGLLMIGVVLIVAESTGWCAPPREKWRFTGGGAEITLEDIDGDGRPEILFGTSASGSIFCVDGRGKLRFAYREAIKIRYIGYVSAADVDGDGRMEVIGVGRERRAICVSAEGKLKWRRWLPGPGVSHAGPVVADVTGDARPELFFGGDDGHLYCIDGDGRVVWTFRAAGGYGDPPVVGDVNGDGQPEILVGSSDSYLYCLDRRGNVLWKVKAEKDCSSGPVLADLDGDGTAEVLFGSNEGTLRCVSGADGTVLWTFKVVGVIRNSICAADLNGDGKLEVLVGCMDAVRCLSSSGKLLWEFAPKGTELRAHDQTAVVGDVNGDGKPEVVFGGMNGYLYCVDATGHELWRLGGGIGSTPALADVDGDGKLEILCGSDNGIVCLATGAPYRPESVLWGQTRLNARLNASLLNPAPTPPEQVVTTYKEGPNQPPYRVSIVAQPTYHSYSALGDVDVYLDSGPDASLDGLTLVMEVTGGQQTVLSSRNAVSGRRTMVEHVPLGALLQAEPSYTMVARIEDADGKVLSQSKLDLERVTPGPLLERAAALEQQLDEMARQLENPPPNSPAGFTHRLVAVGKDYAAWARDEIKAMRLDEARRRLEGLAGGLPDLAKRVQAALEPAARQAQDYPGYRKGHIAFDAGKALLIDGKPTFPVGIYNAATPQEIADIAGIGFDTTFSGGGSDFWRACTDKGVYVIVGLGGEGLADYRVLLAATPSLELTAREKMLLAWYVADEPSLREVPVDTMRRVCDAVRKLDPYHPTLICDGNPAGGWRYTSLADIALPAFYPFWKAQDATAVADRMDEAMKENRGQLPTWFVVQAFTGRAMRFPTPAEERAMAFLVIIHGGRGVHYFRYWNPNAGEAGGGFYLASRDDPTLWASIQRDVKQMKALEPYLVASYRRMEVLRQGDRRLDICVIERDGEFLIIACNPTEKVARWKLAPRELAKFSVTAEVMFEDRRVAVKNGIIEDEFQPQEVHIYRCQR